MPRGMKKRSKSMMAKKEKMKKEKMKKEKAKEILFLKKTLNSLLAEHTGQPLEKINEDTERDYFL